MEFTHFNDAGYARMVDVSAKTDTVRIAAAQAVVRMRTGYAGRHQERWYKKR